MQERLSFLFEKFVGNRCTWEEYNEFLSLIRNAENDPELKALIEKHFEHYGLPLSSNSNSIVDAEGRLVAGNFYNFPPITEQKRWRKGTIQIALVAAAIAILFFMVLPLVNTKRNTANPPLAVLEKSTSKAEKKYIVLSDSTKVWLNAASSLNFPEKFEGNKREVMLTGEAFFDVKHADKIPFIIHSGKVTTTVLGTAFNIKAYPEQSSITVSVSRGKVKVDNGITITTLVKGQEAKVNIENNKVTSKEVETGKIATWQEGELVYDDIPLGDILLDLENVYGVEIEINDTELKNTSVTASFRRKMSIDQLLNTLSKLTSSRITKTNTGYLLSN